MNKMAEFYITFIYAFNKTKEMMRLWIGLKRLQTNSPWIVMGDFNNVLFANERIGNGVKDTETTPFLDTVS